MTPGCHDESALCGVEMSADVADMKLELFRLVCRLYDAACYFELSGRLQFQRHETTCTYEETSRSALIEQLRNGSTDGMIPNTVESSIANL